MDCAVVRSVAFTYLDGELHDEARASLEGHLSHCPDCQRLMNLERTFRTRYIEPLGPVGVPERVRSNTLRLLDGLPRVAGDRSWWRSRASLNRPVAIALALLLTITGVSIGIVLARLWHTEHTAGPSYLLQLADASVMQHQNLVRGRLPYDVAGGEPQAVEQWFDERLDFKVRFPRLAQRGLTFVGGRILQLEGADVAALHYRLEGQDVSLFVLPLDNRQPGRVDSRKFEVISRHGYDVIVWSAHGVTYSLVSEIGTRACMVCHSPGDRLDLSLSPHDGGRL